METERPKADFRSGRDELVYSAYEAANRGIRFLYAVETINETFERYGRAGVKKVTLDQDAAKLLMSIFSEISSELEYLIDEDDEDDGEAVAAE